MKTALKILAVFAALAIFAVACKIGYRGYIEYKSNQAQQTSTETQTTSAATLPVTTLPSTTLPEPIKIEIPDELILYTAENNPGSPEGSTTDKTDFENSVFVGDSVSLGFSRYCAKKGILKDTVFLTAGSYSVGYAMSSDTSENKGFKHPTFKGKETPFKTAVAELMPSNIYICLGINDIAERGVKGTVETYCKLINSVWEINPDAHIYVVSTTFLVHEAQKTKLNNLNLANLNHNMKAICETYNNLDYIDIMSSLQDNNFALSGMFCSDKYIHQNDFAYYIWTKELCI